MGAVRRPVVRACECECEVRVILGKRKKKWETGMKFGGEVGAEGGRGDGVGKRGRIRGKPISNAKAIDVVGEEEVRSSRRVREPGS